MGLAVNWLSAVPKGGRLGGGAAAAAAELAVKVPERGATRMLSGVK
jgi:hypothetical protein